MDRKEKQQQRLQAKLRAKAEAEEGKRQQKEQARQQRILAKKKELKDLFDEFDKGKENGINFPTPVGEKYEETKKQMTKELSNKLYAELEQDEELFYNKQGFLRKKSGSGGKTYRQIAYDYIKQRSLEIPNEIYKTIDGMKQEEAINKFSENIGKEKRDNERAMARALAERLPKLQAREKRLQAREKYIEALREFERITDERVAKGELLPAYGRPPQFLTEDEELFLNKTDKEKGFTFGMTYGYRPPKTTITREERVKEKVKEKLRDDDDSGFLLNELGRLEERALGKRFKQYKVSKDFNQSNGDKFGLNDDGTPRSRRQFAHRFRGKTETQVDEMLSREVAQRTPEQRGAFVGRANRVLERQDITERGVARVDDAGGVKRIGAGEFIGRELAQQDIEQIVPDPSARGFVGKEFTPDNMRRIGPISKEEEGVIGIRQRKEKQYQKEWSADGTTLRNYGFGVLNQEKQMDDIVRQDRMLNAVALNLQALTEGKPSFIETEELEQFQEGVEESRKIAREQRELGIGPQEQDFERKMKTQFRNSSPYIQAQNNYALQNRLINVFEKEPQTIAYLNSLKDANGDDFVSVGGTNDTAYVDTNLNFSSKGYLARFNQLRSQGIEPLQFLLNTSNSNILKFESAKPIDARKVNNGVGPIAVMNEVMMGGRIAFIGHTGRFNVDPVVNQGGVQQSGSALGYAFGYMNVFNNPFIPEENSVKPMIEQNLIHDMTTPKTDITNIQQRSKLFGEGNLTGGGITLTEGSRTAGTTLAGRPYDKILIDRIEQRGADRTQPATFVSGSGEVQEQIRKGTFLPQQVAQDSGSQLRQELRKKQLRANSFGSIALQNKKRFGFQTFA